MLKSLTFLRETICMLLLPVIFNEKACQKDFAVPGQNWRDFATARSARKSDFVNAYLREEIRRSGQHRSGLETSPTARGSWQTHAGNSAERTTDPYINLELMQNFKISAI